LLLAVVLIPLIVGAIVTGVFGTAAGGKLLGHGAVACDNDCRRCHFLCTFGLGVDAGCARRAFQSDGLRMDGGGLRMEIGFMIDGMTAMMMCVVTFVSLMVHLYTGYMQGDAGYNRFFAYIVPVHLCHAHAGDEQQPAAAFLWLGRRGLGGLLSADRFLV
jgi:NADH-quinone oxidoreductase subunit L